MFQPLAFWVIYRIFPSTVKKLSKTDVDLALYSFIIWCVIPTASYMTKEAVAL